MQRGKLRFIYTLLPLLARSLPVSQLSALHTSAPLAYVSAELGASLTSSTPGPSSFTLKLKVKKAPRLKPRPKPRRRAAVRAQPPQPPVLPVPPAPKPRVLKFVPRRNHSQLPKAEVPQPKAEVPQPKAEVPQPKAEVPQPKAKLARPLGLQGWSPRSMPRPKAFLVRNRRPKVAKHRRAGYRINGSPIVGLPPFRKYGAPIPGLCGVGSKRLAAIAKLASASRSNRWLFRQRRAKGAVGYIIRPFTRAARPASGSLVQQNLRKQINRSKHRFQFTFIPSQYRPLTLLCRARLKRELLITKVNLLKRKQALRPRRPLRQQALVMFSPRPIVLPQHSYILLLSMLATQPVLNYSLKYCRLSRRVRKILKNKYKFSKYFFAIAPHKRQLFTIHL